MKRLLLLLAVLWTAGSLRGQVLGPRFMWAKTGYAVSAGATVFPKGQRQALATSRGTVLWVTLQAFKRDYAGYPCGNHLMQVFNDTGGLLRQSAVLGTVTIIDAEADVNGTWYLLGSFVDSVSFPNGKLLVSPIHADRCFIARLDGRTLACDWVVPTSFATRDADCMTMADDGIYYAAADSAYYTSINRLAYSTGGAYDAVANTRRRSDPIHAG